MNPISLFYPIFIIQILLLGTVRAFSDIHNSVVGLPQITCERDFIRFEVQTEKPFRGKVFVKGEYGNVHCTRTYNNGRAVPGIPPSSATISPYWDKNGQPNLGKLGSHGSNHPGGVEGFGPGLSFEGKSNPLSKNGNNNQNTIEEPDSSKYERDPRDGQIRGPDDTQSDIFGHVTSPNNLFGPAPPGAVPTPKFGSTTTPKGGFAHASGQVESGEIPGDFDTTLTPEGQLGPKLKIFGPGKSTPNSSNQNGEPIITTIQPPGFSTGPPGAVPDHIGSEPQKRPSDQVNSKTTRNSLDKDHEWSQSTRAPNVKTANSMLGSLKGETEKIFPSQCPSTCAPCACDDDDEDGDELEGRSSIRGRREAQNAVTLEVPLGECRAKRDRVVSPPGVYVSFVAVISFHENFITKLDRAYHIKCAYQESNKTVETSIDVSNPPSEDLSGQVQPPQCQYRLRTPDGQEIRNRNVQVGDIVRHEWSCETPFTDMYGLHVHSCFVEDGKGVRQMLIDDKGCSIDTDVLPNPTYSASTLLSYVDAFVFKFPDRETLDFQCSMSLCAKEGDGCEGITPPLCDPITTNRIKRSSLSRRTNSSRQSPEWTLHSPTLTVVDIDNNMDRAVPSAWSQPELPPAELCLSIAAFGILVSISTFMTTIAVGAIMAFIFLRKTTTTSF